MAERRSTLKNDHFTYYPVLTPHTVYPEPYFLSNVNLPQPKADRSDNKIADMTSV